MVSRACWKPSAGASLNWLTSMIASVASSSAEARVRLQSPTSTVDPAGSGASGPVPSALSAASSAAADSALVPVSVSAPSSSPSQAVSAARPMRPVPATARSFWAARASMSKFMACLPCGSVRDQILVNLIHEYNRLCRASARRGEIRCRGREQGSRMHEDATVTSTDLARLAGVGRNAVSNWRRRERDFPAPVEEGTRRPRFALPDIERWAAEHGRRLRITPADRLWFALRGAHPTAEQALQAITDALDAPASASPLAR